MKPQGLLSVIIFTLLIWSCRSLLGCPTCIARLDDSRPAFFHATFYSAHKENKKHDKKAPDLKTVYQRAVAAQKKGNK